MNHTNVSRRRPRISRSVMCLCALSSAAALVGCNAGGPITVVSAYGPGIKFSGLGPSYAWAPEPAEGRIGSPGLHELIHSYVEKRLAAKGFAKNSTGAADFLIDYRVGRREKTYAGAVAFGET